MKWYHATDESGVTFDDRDRDIAHAAADTADSLLGLAEAAGVLGTGDCDGCGQTNRLRPYPIYDGQNFLVANICPDCQAEKTEDARQNYASDDPKTPPSERGGE